MLIYYKNSCQFPFFFIYSIIFGCFSADANLTRETRIIFDAMKAILYTIYWTMLPRAWQGWDGEGGTLPREWETKRKTDRLEGGEGKSEQNWNRECCRPTLHAHGYIIVLSIHWWSTIRRWTVYAMASLDGFGKHTVSEYTHNNKHVDYFTLFLSVCMICVSTSALCS